MQSFEDKIVSATTAALWALGISQLTHPELYIEIYEAIEKASIPYVTSDTEEE
jgi:hypothetical protein